MLAEIQPIEALFRISICYFDYRKKSFLQPIVSAFQPPPHNVQPPFDNFHSSLNVSQTRMHPFRPCDSGLFLSYMECHIRSAK